MKRKIPVGENQPHIQKPVAEGIRESSRMSFGFSYFRQIDWFGLNRSSLSWAVSFLERLGALSQEEWDSFVADPAKRDTLRFHEIDWDAEAIPIRRSDLNWLPRDYADNPEYPFYQFHVSKAMGRFMGFRDEKGVFQVVLLDPLHNLQPSGVFDYRVRPCGPLESHYDTLRAALDRALQNAKCTAVDCELAAELQKVQIDDAQILLMHVRDGDSETAQKLLEQGKCKSLYEIFERGLLELL